MRSKQAVALSLYVLSVFLVSASNFATAPLLLAQIGAEKYAVWAQIEPIVLTAIPLAGLGLHIGYLNAFGQREDMTSRLFPFHVLFVAATALSVTLFLTALGLGINIAILAGAVILSEAVIIFFIAHWRANEQPGQFATFEGGRSLMVVLIIAAFALANTGFPENAGDYLFIRGAVAAIAVCLGYAFLRWPMQPDWAAAKRAIRYGLPIVIASASVVIIMNFDRYGVSLSAGALALTSYVAHVKIVQILGSALAPFFAWFAPLAIKRLKADEDSTGFFRVSFLYFATVNLSLSLGLWLITPLLWPLLFPSLAFDQPVFLLLLAGTTAFACGNPVSIGTLIEGRTSRALLFTGCAAVIGFALIMILAPIYGAFGVALARCCAMIAYTVLFARDTLKSTGVKYNWLGISVLAITCVVLSAFANSIETSQIQQWISAFVFPSIFLVGSLFAIRGKLLR